MGAFDAARPVITPRFSPRASIVAADGNDDAVDCREAHDDAGRRREVSMALPAPVVNFL